MKVIAYIGLGSNLDGPEKQIRLARKAIKQVKGNREVAFSSLYHSPPMGPKDQPDFVNAVMALETDLPALELLHSLQNIECTQGRVRKEVRWEARTLDLDLLLYADQQITTANLIVPHYGIAERAFVLYPLLEIAPDLKIPGKGTVSDLIGLCSRNGLIKAGEG